MNSETISGLETVAGGEKALLAGRYRVVKQLGQGGMGSVWLAEDTELADRQVAIKMLPAIFVANKRACQQLKREAVVALGLNHTNICALRSFEDNGGNPFLVMDYIDGQTLDDVLAEKSTLTEEETVRLLAPVAAALDYAHKKGVVHRDVKPGNVMIARDGTPYVLDFGIAREIQETLTRVTGSFSSGTLMYMSPEQLNGDAPNAAQDVYSFAALAYECLVGHPPFCRGDISSQILHKAPEPLPAELKIAHGVMAGLAKQARKRPASCTDVLATRPSAADPEPEDSELAVPLAQIAQKEQELQQKEEQRRRQAERAEQDRKYAEALAQARARMEALNAKEKSLRENAAGDLRTVELPGGVQVRFAWCPTGKDLNGEVVQGFWMGVTEVTQAQWTRVMGNNPSEFKGDDRPVEQVSWDDCQVFVKKCQAAGVKVRLPTEREWEYACRAGGTGDWGKRKNGGEGPLDAMGWYWNNSGRETHPVAQKEPNAWGLYDMHGNVLEWCEDADGSIRVDRGGGWSSDSDGCAAGNRCWNSPDFRYSYLGFRLALSQD